MRQWFSGFRFKMLTLIGISSAIVAGISAFSYWQLGTIGEKLKFANTVRIPVTQHVNAMDAQIHASTRFLWALLAEETPQGTERIAKIVETEMKGFEEAEEAAKALPMAPAIKEKFEIVVKQWPPLKEKFQNVISQSKVGTPEARANAKRIIIEEIRPLNAEMGKAIDELNEVRQALVDKEVVQLAEDQKQAEFIMLLASLGAFLGIGIIGFTIASRVANVLTDVIQNLSHHSKEVSQASEGLSTAASGLSTGATETASSLEETVASTEELNSMVKTNADNARTASALATEGRANAEVGEKNITALYEAVGEVSKASKEIEQIIGVIDDIAFQTNLLALNAAVEAARAGEQGKGFAVVAEAVRNLAQRSAVAAKDISKLIVDSVDKTNTSRALAEKSKESLSLIVTSIHKIADINTEIATASQEQSMGLGNISKAMNEIDRATQQNAASSEEISATSEEMTSQSISLEKLVSDLVVLVNGGEGNRDKMERELRMAELEKTSKKDSKGKKTFSSLESSKVVSLQTKVKSKEAQMEEILPLESSSDRSVSRVEGF